MELGLINAGLAAGAALAAVPVILHLFMRQTPKRVVFPALQLIRERQKRSRKRLKIKNWLLLLARMALLALMALALARPTLTTEASLGDQEVPSAIGLVFDTSLSMGYTERDKTRLDEAKSRAEEILSKATAGSQVFVVDSAEPRAPAALTPSAARKRIQALAIRATNRPLNASLGLAYAAVADAEKPRREVYVLTDLSRTAWDTESAAEGIDRAAKANIQTYVLRLTPNDPRNVAVVDAGPTAAVVTAGEPLEVIARVRGVGPAATRVAELRLDGVVREKKAVEIPADSEVDVRFNVPKVDGPTPVHQGEVRLTGAPDPLAFDDIRYFSFEVKPPVRVLVVSDQPIDGRFIGDAIDPDPASLPPGTPRPYRADRIGTPEFLDRSANLERDYECVFLNNVSSLSEAEWGRLGGFVRGGGGLVVGLGGPVVPASYQSDTAGQVLPAVPQRKTTPNPATTFGRIADYSHPLFNRYSRELDDMLSAVPVTRYWGVTVREGSRVLLDYADQAPALLERSFRGTRTGRVLLWTTPLSRRPEPGSPDAWNEFPNPFLGWSFFHLINQSVAYLVGVEEQVHGHEAGQDVALAIDPSRRSRSYLVQGPEARSRDRLSPPATGDSLLIVAPEALGHWKVSGDSEEPGKELFGFSVNAPVGESSLVPLETADLDRLFGGKARYSLADSPKSLDQMVKIGRFGRELYPWLMAIILLLVTLESLLANRFHREAPGAERRAGAGPSEAAAAAAAPAPAGGLAGTT